MGYMWGLFAGGGRGDCRFVAVAGVGVAEDGGGRCEEGVEGVRWWSGVEGMGSLEGV